MPYDYFGYDTPASVVEAAKRYPSQLIGSDDVSPLCALLASLPPGTPIAVDCETTGLFPYEGDVLRGVSIAFRLPSTAGVITVGEPLDAKQVLALAADWADRTADGMPAVLTEGASFTPTGRLHSFYIPVGYPYPDSLSEIGIRQVFRVLKDVDPFLVLHHGKFDFAFLRQLPTDTDGSVFFAFPESDQWWDTKVVAWLLDENMPSGLKEQAAFHWGIDEREEQKAIKALVRKKGWAGITAEETAPYAAKDAEQTLRLYELQQQLVDGQAPILGTVRSAIARELDLQGVLLRLPGILVDADLIETMRVKTAARVAEIEARFADVHFIAESTGSGDAPPGGVNISSPLQLAAYLYDGLGLPCKSKTPGGARSVNRDALEALPETPETGLLLEHRRLKKALTGYLVPLAERIGIDGRIHPHFSSTGTVTGRFSCSQPNLQTIPRGDTLTGIRDVFIAEYGFELWEYDLQAAEMRVMAGMAGEQVLLDALNDGTDVHAEAAARVFGPDFTGLQRRYAKNIGYGFNYGLTSPATAAKYISGPDAVKIATKILDGLKKMYPAIMRLMRTTTKEAEKHGMVAIGEAWPGRYRRFQTPSVRRPQAYTALNAKIQGGIGEFMKDVMLEAEEVMAKLGARICLQVHDSLIIEVPEGEGEYIGTWLQEIADKLNPFVMPMIFEGHEWGSHE